MKMIHKDCGGKVQESESKLGYQSEEHGFVPAYECLKCDQEILGDSQIEFVPESESDKIQIEGMWNNEKNQDLEIPS